ncbi:hypothetical protein IM40_09580 (plasmid) [Candidatus Paracaedimonas acanthamoebae]|nr:hypothetical protein IM40_09580 [Candidatus Paracaedimonas acanthamoebae]
MSTQIDLKYPIMAEGREITSLTLRRPTVRDRLIAERTNGTNFEKEIRLVAALCDLAPNIIESLDMADYSELQDALSDFLS